MASENQGGTPPFTADQITWIDELVAAHCNELRSKTREQSAGTPAADNGQGASGMSTLASASILETTASRPDTPHLTMVLPMCTCRLLHCGGDRSAVKHRR